MAGRAGQGGDLAGKAAEAAARKERLAKALRENLRRRKARQRTGPDEEKEKDPDCA